MNLHTANSVIVNKSGKVPVRDFECGWTSFNEAFKEVFDGVGTYMYKGDDIWIKE